jgi:hypothetical protein
MRSNISGVQIPTAAKLNIDGEFTLDASAGTSGQVLISQGSGNTPSWTSSLTSMTSISSATSTALSVTTGAATGANTGSLNLTTGAATTSGASGNIYIDVGGVNSGQIKGMIAIGTTPFALGNGNTGNIYIGNNNAPTTTTVYGTLTSSGAKLNTPLLTSVSTIGGGGAEGGQIDFARVTDGTAYWHLDSYGTTSTPSLRFIEDATTQISIDTGGIVNLSGALKVRSGSTAANSAPIYLASSSSTLTTPVYGAVESTADAIYITDNPGSTTTGAGRGRVPIQQTVFAQADSSTSINTTVNVFASTYDVLSVLEPNKLYRFRAKYYSALTYAGSNSSISILFAFSNAPTAIRYSFKTYPQVAGTGTTQQGASAVTTSTAIVPSQSASGAWVTEIDGYFKTHATLTSTFTPQFAGNASFSTTSVIQSGSYMEIEKLGASSTAIVSGNWA